MYNLVPGPENSLHPALSYDILHVHMLLRITDIGADLHIEIIVLRPESDPFDQNRTRRNRLVDLVADLKHAAKTRDKAAIDAALRNIVPEYTGSDTLTILQVREKKQRLRLLKKK